MKVTGQNMSMIRGDSEYFTVSCINSDGVDVPFVTGDTIYFTVKENASTTTKLIQKVITTFTTDGKAEISILPADTKPLKFKQYVYDIEYVKADGTVTTIIPVSKFTIAEEVTYE